MSTPPTVVVPIAVLQQESVPEALAEFLAPVPVLVIGVVDIPDQTSPKQAREQFEDDARRTVDTVADTFAAAGGDVDTRLTFTHNPRTTIERVAADIDRVAILFPAPATDVESVLLAVRGDINVPNIVATVATLVDNRDTTVTVYHGTTAESSEGERVVAGAVRALEESGVDPSHITATIEQVDRPLNALLDRARAHDLLVVGEDEPTLSDRIFGDTSERLAKQTAVPALVVRRPPS